MMTEPNEYLYMGDAEIRPMVGWMTFDLDA